MITKTVTVDEKAVFDTLLPMLDERYKLCYVDYRDELPANTIQQCLDKKSRNPLDVEDLWWESREYNARHILEELMDKAGYSRDEQQLFIETEEYQQLICEIECRDVSTPVMDACRQTVMHGYVRFHSNYDCWLPIWEQGGIQAEETALGGIMAALSLNPAKVREAARKTGIDTFGRFRNIPSREGKELVDYDGFIRVLIETPNYGNWAFFGRLDLQALLKNKFNPDGLTIPEGTTCAMFNWWNGGGSLDFCNTLRPVTVGELRRRLARYKDDIKVVVDERSNREHGYTPSDVYGDHISEDKILAA